MPVGPISRSIAKNSNALLGQAPQPVSPGFVGSGQGFTPLSISGLLGWWDANTIGKNVGDPVAFWPDSYGHYDLSQATTSKQPTMQFVNGRPWVQFDGVDDLIKRTGTFSGFSFPTISFGCVIRRTAASAGNSTHLALRGDGGIPQYWALATLSYASGSGGNNCVFSVPNGASIINLSSFLMSTYSSVVADNTFRFNGVTNSTWSPATPSAQSPYTPDAIVLGNNFGETQAAPCLIAEAWLFGRGLTTLELVAMEQYAAKKWTINLP